MSKPSYYNKLTCRFRREVTRGSQKSCGLFRCTRFSWTSTEEISEPLRVPILCVVSLQYLTSVLSVPYWPFKGTSLRLKVWWKKGMLRTTNWDDDTDLDHSFQPSFTIIMRTRLILGNLWAFVKHKCGTGIVHSWQLNSLNPEIVSGVFRIAVVQWGFSKPQSWLINPFMYTKVQ